MKHLLKSTIPIMILLFSLSAAGQNALYNRVQLAHNSNVQFEQVTLFNTTTGDAHKTVVKNATLFIPDETSIASLYARKPNAVILTFTTITGKSYTIEMLQSHPLANNASVGAIDRNGRHKRDYDPGVHYQGIVKGSDKSMASMSVFANGDVMILFANSEGNFVMGKLEDGTGNYILYNDNDMLLHHRLKCGFKGNKNFNYSNTADMERTTAVRVCHRVNIYWESDYNLYTYEGGFTATQTYLIGLFNQMQTLFANENIAIELKSLFIWTIDDTYTSSAGPDEIFIFASYWNYMGNNYDGNIATFVTKDGGGGVTFGNIPMCNKPTSYNYVGVDGSYSTLPTYSWDVEVVTHETGHSFGLDHTHNCGWHTGPGGTCGAIDNCSSLEDSGSCHAPCPSTDSVGKGSWQGTIMSYCSNINLALGFGPLPGNFIRNTTNNCTSLKSVIDVSLTPASICTNDGSVGLTYNTDNLGTPPYTYHWSNGSTTSNIFGLSTAGTYSVTITDSNNCSVTASVNLPKLASPGNGKGPIYQPICCKDTSFTYTLNATTPANLLPCQTVAWLRTTTAIASFATAQVAYNSANPSDILSSTDSATISTSTNAILNIPSPVPCAIQSFYYTPFITRKKRVAYIEADSSNTIAGQVKYSSYQIGKYVNLPAVTSPITVCDANDTPAVYNLKITVGGYTGRTNYMSIVVASSSGEGLYLLNGLAGNGTYTVPVKATDTLLRAMKISVFDYNMANKDSAVVSTVGSIKAVRTETYPAITQTSFENVCNVGTSAHLSFAPTGCVKLDASNIEPIDNNLSVYPNPANDHVTLEFSEHRNGSGVIRITDVVGRSVQTIPITYTVGKNKMNIDVHEYANGIYFLLFSTEDGITDKVKLTIAR